MPITCPIAIPRISTDEFRKLDYKVMGLAFASHREIGRLADERVYQADLVARLSEVGLEAQREVPITVTFQSFIKTYYMDVIAAKAVYELKTVAKLSAEHEAQLLNYLLMVDAGHGKLINYRTASVESRFVNAPLCGDSRRSFVVTDHGWRSNPATKELLLEMICDWGTSLKLSLYHQGFVNLLGGEEKVTKQLPMMLGGISLGTQRFHLLDPETAFRMTAFSKLVEGYDQQLRRLLKLSQLKSIQWINIGHEEVGLVAIDRKEE